MKEFSLFPFSLVCLPHQEKSCRRLRANARCFCRLRDGNEYVLLICASSTSHPHFSESKKSRETKSWLQQQPTPISRFELMSENESFFSFAGEVASRKRNKSGCFYLRIAMQTLAYRRLHNNWNYSSHYSIWAGWSAPLLVYIEWRLWESRP